MTKHISLQAIDTDRLFNRRTAATVPDTDSYFKAFEISQTQFAKWNSDYHAKVQAVLAIAPDAIELVPPLKPCLSGPLCAATLIRAEPCPTVSRT